MFEPVKGSLAHLYVHKKADMKFKGAVAHGEYFF